MLALYAMTSQVMDRAQPLRDDLLRHNASQLDDRSAS
jgi:hypothetical protein